MAGAVAVTKFTPTTAAFVDSSSVSTPIAINITSTANNSTSTIASGATTRKNASSVGVAVAISDSVVSNTATVENTLGTTKPTTLTAANILVKSGTPNSPNTLNASTNAISGVYASDLGAAGALALNLVSNTTEASVANNSSQTTPLPATVSMAGNVTFNAQDAATEKASALPPEGFDGSSVAAGSGLGAALAINIDTNTTKADIQDSALLTDAKNLTFNANSNDTVGTYSAMGASGGLLSITPTAAVTVATVSGYRVSQIVIAQDRSKETGCRIYRAPVGPGPPPLPHPRLLSLPGLHIEPRSPRSSSGVPL